MCRPSCCNNSSHGSGGTGLAIIAILLAAGLVITKIGPAIGEIGRIVLDMVRIAALGTGSAVVLAAIVWLAVRRAGRSIRQRSSQQLAKDISAMCVAGLTPASEQSCLTCGDRGHVIRVIGNGVFLARPCPDCQPAQLAG
jgi:hypothetical protein